MSSYMGDDLEKELQDAKDAADKTKDAARKTKNVAKTIKNLKNGHKAAKTAGKATKAAAKGAAAAGKAVAFFTTPMGLGVLIAIILSVIILVVGSLIVAAPSVIWNEMTHTDEHLDPGKSIEKELQIDDNTMKEREQEWADIVNEEIDGSHEDMMDEIKKHCKANGVDYEATKENIVDSTDFLGSQETEDKSDAYQNEQKFYQIFKDKGYSEIASITMVSAMDYLTEVDPSYNLLADEAFDNVKLTGKKKSFKSHKYLNAFGEPKVGVLKFNKSDFVAYVRTAYGKKKGKGKNQQMTIPLKTLKAKMLNIKVQSDFADMLLTQNISKKDLKTLQKTKSSKTAAKILAKCLPMLANNTGTINGVKEGADRLKNLHQINPDRKVSISGTAKEDGSIASGNFMDTMDELAHNFAKYKFKYSPVHGKANYKRGLKTNRLVNCANYVCWGLQESGLVPKNTMIWCGNGRIRGNSKSQKVFKNKKNFMLKQHVDKSLKKCVKDGLLKPGDIVGAQTYAHTMVYRGKIKGKYTFYSVGRKATNSHIPSKITNNHRSGDYRVGVIIRPLKAGTVTKGGSSGEDVKEKQRAKELLAGIRSKSNYPASTIKSYRKNSLAAYKSKKKKVDAAYAALRDAGLSPCAAAGILGNAYQESGWSTTVVSRDGHGSQGLIQWTGDRKTKMKSWIKSKGGSWKNMTWQAKYAAYEIKYGGENSSFNSCSGNVIKYGSGFWKVKPYYSYKKFASTDDVLRATVNYCACIERCAITQSGMANRYAAAEVILEKCAGIKAGDMYGDMYGDPEGEIQAGSRQMAMILSAFSVKESQLLPIDKQIKIKDEEMKKIENGRNAGTRFQAFLKKHGIHISDSAANGINFIGGIATEKYYEIKNAVRDMKPKVTLRHALRKNKAKLYDVHYGEIVKDKKGRKIYANIEISPASAKTIAKSVFGLDPKSIYKTSDDNKPIGAKDTTVSQAITTMTDNHMELLYGNHEYGGALQEGSISLVYNGSGKVGNPLGTKKITSEMFTSFFGNRPYPGAGGTTNHGGVDISWGGCYGKPVYAAVAGKITRASSFSGYGNCVDINGNGLMVRYGHLSNISVKVGQRVKKGQKIGNIGSTGNSTGPHLHFEVRVGGKGVDPFPYLFKYTKGMKLYGNKQRA